MELNQQEALHFSSEIHYKPSCKSLYVGIQAEEASLDSQVPVKCPVNTSAEWILSQLHYSTYHNCQAVSYHSYLMELSQQSVYITGVVWFCRTTITIDNNR